MPVSLQERFFDGHELKAILGQRGERCWARQQDDVQTIRRYCWEMHSEDTVGRYFQKMHLGDISKGRIG